MSKDGAKMRKRGKIDGKIYSRVFNCFRFASPPRPLEGLRPRGYDEVVGKASEKAKRGMILGLSSFFLALLTLIRINDLA